MSASQCLVCINVKASFLLINIKQEIYCGIIKQLLLKITNEYAFHFMIFIEKRCKINSCQFYSNDLVAFLEQ